MVESDQAKILWDLQINTDKIVMTNQLDIAIIDMQKRTAVVVNVAIPNDGNIRKKVHGKLEKYETLSEELEKTWQVKATLLLVVIGAHGPVTPTLEK